MRTFYVIVVQMVAAATMSLSAQQPDGDIVLGGDVDSTAISILERYGELYPELEQSMLIRSWRPRAMVAIMLPIGSGDHLWEQSAVAPSVKLIVPKFIDYNSITLRLGNNGSTTLTISNGSAYNFMPWPNYPGAYRDARTLSFPVPR